MHSSVHFYYHNKKSNLKLSTFERENTCIVHAKGKWDVEMLLLMAVVFSV